MKEKCPSYLACSEVSELLRISECWHWELKICELGFDCMQPWRRTEDDKEEKPRWGEDVDVTG